MAGYPNDFHYPYIPAHMLQLAYQQKYNQLPPNPAPPAWIPKYINAQQRIGFINYGNAHSAPVMNRESVAVVQNAPNGIKPSQASNSRKRTRDDKHLDTKTNYHTDAKKTRKQGVESSTNASSTSSSTPDNHRDTSSPVQVDVMIANAVAAYERENAASPEVDQKEPQNSVHQRKDDTSKEIAQSSSSLLQQRTSKNLASSEDSKQSSTSDSKASNSKASPVLSRGVVTPPPLNIGRNSTKRKASGSSLTNSAPPAVKDKHARAESAVRDENYKALQDTPTSSRQANNQRRNSLPAQVKDTLSDQILNRYHLTKQQDTDLHRKEDMRVQLENIIHEVMPCTLLFLVGSSKNCFGTRTSDADMCLMVTEGEINQKRAAKNILYKLRDYLRDRCHFMKQLQVIPAKVPIIKFRHKYSGLECDLNINNATGIRNTHLLQSYAKLDNRVAPLVLMVKQWAGYHNINDASQGTLSSYSLVLMVLNYLQVRCKPPVLPALQQRYSSTFTKFSDVRQFHSISPNTPLASHIAGYRSENKQDVGALLKGFFDYYANNFVFSKDVISVRLGKVINLNQVKTPDGDWLGKHIHIEEPFDCTNTARAVYRIEKFVIIKNRFKDAQAKFKSGAPNMKLDKVIGRYMC